MATTAKPKTDKTAKPKKAVVAKKALRQIGNTYSLTLDKARREAAGFSEGQALKIEAVKGRLVVTAADDADYRDAMDAYEESVRRYQPVYDALAK